MNYLIPTNNSIEIVNEGIAFYQRLLKVDASLIEAGGLTMEEVKDALGELSAKNQL